MITHPHLGSIARALVCTAALAAASAPAFAQSREYQRGYEQGYRDGVEATQNQGPDRRGSRIRLERAIYGFRGDVCDATDAVRNVAGGRRNVEIMANNELCGDPAPGRAKTLTVTYRCADEAVRRASVREAQALTLTCR